MSLVALNGTRKKIPKRRKPNVIAAVGHVVEKCASSVRAFRIIKVPITGPVIQNMHPTPAMAGEHRKRGSPLLPHHHSLRNTLLKRQEPLAR